MRYWVGTVCNAGLSKWEASTTMQHAACTAESEGVRVNGAVGPRGQGGLMFFSDSSPLSLPQGLTAR